MDWLLPLKDWLLGLGETYGVNPIIFSSLYIGSIPFFMLSMGWVIRNIRQKKPLVIPLLFAGIFFISSYLYLIVAGKNIPLWVYLFIIAMVGFGVISTLKKMRKSSD